MLTSDAQRKRFLELLGDLGDRFEIETHVYCLMGNRYHLLLQTPLGNLVRGIRHFDGGCCGARPAHIAELARGLDR